MALVNKKAKLRKLTPLTFIEIKGKIHREVTTGLSFVNHEL